MSKSVVIIGAGLGGLFTGALLSKEGFKVTLLEKNATVGGGLQSFKRFGIEFDTGMHVIGGMQKGGNIRKICNYLGILKDIEIRDVDVDCTDKLYFAEDKTYYTIAKGKENFILSLAQQFPQQEENLRNYVNVIFSLADSIDLFNLRPSESYFHTFSDEMVSPADEFIAKYITDKKLQSVIAYMNPLYGGRGGETPTFIHAIINVLYINGASRFVDGSYKFADLLVKVIEENGGTVYVNEGVSHITTSSRHINSVETVKGNTYSADYYISDIHPCSLLTLIDDKALPKMYRERLNLIPNSYSAFSLYIKLKKNSFPYINHSEYYMSKYDQIWNFGEVDSQWPKGFLMMTPPDSNQCEYADKVLVTAPMPFEYVKQWKNTTVGKRGDDYLAWNQEKTADLLHLIEEIHPGFSECIENINSSSPLTIRDFYNVKEGSLCGYSKDSKNLALSQVPVVTKIDNLFLTGQNNNLHGFCGVPLTAINTCEAIIGMNYIINKINAVSEL